MSHSYHRPPPYKKKSGEREISGLQKIRPFFGQYLWRVNMTSGRQIWTISVYVIGMFPSGPSDKMPSWRKLWTIPYYAGASAPYPYD